MTRRSVLSASVTAAPADRGFRLQVDKARFPVGIVLGERYRIHGLLGRGGMGEVYRAHDLKLDQQLALKFLPESAALNPGLMQRFRSEVRIARQISIATSAAALEVSLAARFGLLALAASIATFRTITGSYPITDDFSAWYASQGLVHIAFVAAIAVWCFHHALGGPQAADARVVGQFDSR